MNVDANISWMISYNCSEIKFFISWRRSLLYTQWVSVICFIKCLLMNKSSVVQVSDWCYIGNGFVPEPMVTNDVILQAKRHR